MVITHNIMATNAAMNLDNNNNRLKKNLEKLSSGYKINRAADDAAGLAISEQMRSKIRGLDQGMQNIKEGIGYVQVADGALTEVHSMLQRMKKLTTQGANGTYNTKSREAIQNELDELRDEIDRVGEATEYNGNKIFMKGSNAVESGNKVNDGSEITLKQVDYSYSDLSLMDDSLGQKPFDENSPLNYLDLKINVNNPNSKLNGTSYNLLQDNGKSTYIWFGVNYGLGPSISIKPEDLTPIQGSYKYDADTSTWSRSFSYTKTYSNGYNAPYVITQSVKALSDKNEYVVSFNIVDVNVDKYINAGGDIRNSIGLNAAGISVLSQVPYLFIGLNPEYNGSTNLTYYESDDYTLNYPPDSSSVSLVDTNNALPFTQKFSLMNSTNDSDDLSVRDKSLPLWWRARYSKKVGFDENYDQYGDFVFSYRTENRDSVPYQNYGNATFTFCFGIEDTQEELKTGNLKNVTINSNPSTSDDSDSSDKADDIWIQRSSTSWDGLWIKSSKMDSKILGVHDLSVSTVEDANKSMSAVDKAIDKVSTMRSRFGASQNRLEHMLKTNEVASENLTNAESRIRDTDMATEMASYSKNNVLSQASMAMLAQANQSAQSVLQILQ